MGWDKTVDEYYTGSNKKDALGSVRLTLDGVIEELKKDPKRKFTQATTGYLQLWWERQNDETKDLVKQFVKNKQLEFVNGGWVDNDEACPHFDDIINNMMIGHEFIKNTFGVAPKIGWDIDTFGHSDTNTKLFA